jgi:hypothetical protein
MIIMKKGRFRFLPCPICGTQTNTKVLPETILIRYLLFCEKCRQEILKHSKKIIKIFSNFCNFLAVRLYLYVEK